MSDPRIVRYADPAALAESVGVLFLDRIAEATADGSTIHIALTGGTSGIAVLRAAGSDPRRTDIDWSLVHFWWGDERFVPDASPDRNAGQARRALLDHIDVPDTHVHVMAPSDTGVDLDEGARAYAADLARYAEGDDAWPSFDVCFLGVGPDGHIASLFPGRDEVTVSDRAVVAVRDSPKPPPERISLTLPVIASAKRIWLVMAGADKADALALALAGGPATTIPAASAIGRESTVFFVDAAAAAGDLPRD